MAKKKRCNINKKTAEKIFRILEKEYQGATTSLVYKNTMELLVATILSAQCTDKRVNIVTKTLFKKFKKPQDYAKASPAEFEEDIRSTGFYKNKAKNIIAAAKMVDKDFGGKVPDEMEELIKLPGVARKTANIVLFHGYGKTEGIAVDTHVKRLSNRLGLTENKDPGKIEEDLMELYDRKKWGILTVLLIEHGRNICDARKPLCGECKLRDMCLAKGLKGKG